MQELLADPGGFDGSQVTVVGELVGDYGFRSDGTVWAQLNDDSYARAPLLEGGTHSGSNTGIGVVGTEATFRDLDPPGGYAIRGPLVRLSGTWRFHDADRGGESYLHIAALQVLEAGRPLSEDVDPLVLALGSLIAAAAVFLGLRLRNLRREEEA